MSELKQSEADRLLAMKKYPLNSSPKIFPNNGDAKTIELTGQYGVEKFALNVNRKGLLKSSKVTYQNHVRSNIVLARLDIDGPPHRNPDGQKLCCPHMHLYREGFGDKWAYPIPLTILKPNNSHEMLEILDYFLQYNNIEAFSLFQLGLF